MKANKFFIYTLIVIIFAGCVEYRYRLIKLNFDDIPTCNIPLEPVFEEIKNDFQFEAEIERQVLDMIDPLSDPDFASDFKKYVIIKNEKIRKLFINYQLEKDYRQQWELVSDCQNKNIEAITKSSEKKL